MKTKLLTLFIFVIFISCRTNSAINDSLIYENKNYFTLDQSFVDSIFLKSQKSQIEYLKKVKSEYLQSSTLNSVMLSNLESNIKEPWIKYNKPFFENEFKNLVLKKLINTKIQELFIVNILVSGETIINNNYVIVKDLNSNIIMYHFNNHNKNFKITVIYDSLYTTLLSEYMINLPFEFRVKSEFYTGLQYFTIDKVMSKGENNYGVESVSSKLFKYQEKIFNKVFSFEIY